jgi:hypothetical protein
MSKVNEFTQDEWDHLHDVVLGATWETTKIELTQQELENLFQELPEHIKEDAYHWGLNDSVVRDKIYVWYQENKL